MGALNTPIPFSQFRVRDYLNKQYLVIGENHYNAAKDLASVIKAFAPSLVLTEHIGYLRLNTTALVKHRLNNIHSPTMPRNRYTVEWLKLAIDLNIGLIGIDYLPNATGKRGVEEFERVVYQENIVTSFQKRESRMRTVVDEHAKLGNRFVVCVGDTHLRTSHTEELGPGSSLAEYVLNDSRCVVTRLDIGLKTTP